MTSEEQKKEIRDSLKKFGFYFEGKLKGAGNIAPFSKQDLINIWLAINLLK